MNWDHQEIRTFAYLHSAADWAVEQAEAASDRQMFPSMHAILASVHCLEAFTNHLGPRYFEGEWDTRDANLAAPKEKLKALLAQCRIELGDIRSEYDSYMLGLGVRKELTHGRTHEISKGKSRQFVEGSAVSATPPQWQKHCNPETAKRVFEAVTRLVERLGEASGEGKYCYRILGRGFGGPEPRRGAPASGPS
jgi:hypothetical protein